MKHVVDTEGMTVQEPKGTERTQESTEEKDRELGQRRSEEVRQAIPRGENRWSSYPEGKGKAPGGSQ